MQKSPKLLLSLSLPFFIALMFILSVFTYTFSSLLEEKPAIRKSEVAYVLGTKDNSANITPITLDKPIDSVMNNSDGTRTEIHKEPVGNKVSVKIVQYDMFGAKIAEKIYEEGPTVSTSSQVSPTAKIVPQFTKEQLPEKLKGLGFTYDPNKIVTVKNPKGDTFNIPAYRKVKLFGLFPINIYAELDVKATDGGVVNINQSGFYLILNFLSK